MCLHNSTKCGNNLQINCEKSLHFRRAKQEYFESCKKSYFGQWRLENFLRTKRSWEWGFVENGEYLYDDYGVLDDLGGLWIVV